MPIPNVSTLSKRINSGSEGGNEFARIINLLLSADAKLDEKKLQLFNDASGDYYGFDAIRQKYEKYPVNEGFIYKFFPSPFSSKHKIEIRKAIIKVVNRIESISEIYLVTPDELYKNDLIWLKKVEREILLSKIDGVDLLKAQATLVHWGHTRILEHFLRHPHIGKEYYSELFPYDANNFKLALLNYDEKTFSFDFSFINDTSNTYLLNSIDLIKIDCWSAINGIPNKYKLKPIGNLKFKVDLEKDLNTLKLKDPIIFSVNEPKRFKLQLLNFQESCPGNWIEFKFRFHFNNEFYFDSKEITLSC